MASVGAAMRRCVGRHRWREVEGRIGHEARLAAVATEIVGLPVRLKLVAMFGLRSDSHVTDWIALILRRARRLAAVAIRTRMRIRSVRAGIAKLQLRQGSQVCVLCHRPTASLTRSQPQYGVKGQAMDS